MDAKEFYNSGIGEEIEQVHKSITIELMKNYAKHYHESKVETLDLFSVSVSNCPVCKNKPTRLDFTTKMASCGCGNCYFY
jgi:hypothetical protein